MLPKSQVITAHLLRKLLGTNSGYFSHSDITVLSANMFSIQASKTGQIHRHFEVHIEVTLVSAFDRVNGLNKVLPTGNSHVLLHATESDLLFIFSQLFCDLLRRSPLALTWFFLSSSLIVIAADILLLLRLLLLVPFLRPTTFLCGGRGLSGLLYSGGGFTARFGFGSIRGLTGTTLACSSLIFPILGDEVLRIAKIEFEFV